MTPQELNFIKDAFSQIIDDIAGNPDWGDAARAVASNMGTLERELEEKAAIELPFNLDEAAHNFALFYDNGTCDGIAQDCFKAGAEWMARQGETFNGYISIKGKRSLIAIEGKSDICKFGDKVIIQIRKK